MKTSSSSASKFGSLSAPTNVFGSAYCNAVDADRRRSVHGADDACGRVAPGVLTEVDDLALVDLHGYLRPGRRAVGPCVLESDDPIGGRAEQARQLRAGEDHRLFGPEEAAGAAVDARRADQNDGDHDTEGEIAPAGRRARGTMS